MSVDIYADNTVTTRIPPQLIRSDTHGKGAAEIGWGSPGDFKRCEAFARAHGVPGHMIDGFCANLHKLATGEWPGVNAHKGMHSIALDYLLAAMPAKFVGRRWSGPLAPIETPTGDGRIFPAQTLKFQSFPMPLGFQEHSGRGHDGAVTVGVIEHAEEREHNGKPYVWGRGYLLDPEIIPDVRKAEHLIEHGVAGASVDLDSYTAALRMGENGKHLQNLKEGRVRAATVVRIPAFADLRLQFDDTEEKKTVTASVETEPFTVNANGWKGAPVAPREAQFDADDAVSRIEAWAGQDRAALDKLFLWVNPNGDALGRDGYKLPWGDIIDGKPYLIYHAVYAAAALLSGAHGGLPSIPDDEKARLRGVISNIYSHLAQELGDPNIRAPWDQRPDNERVTEAALVASAIEAVIEEYRDMPGGKRQPRVPGVPGARASRHVDNPHGGEFIDEPLRGPHGQVKVGGKWVYPEKGAKDPVASARRIAKEGGGKPAGKTTVAKKAPAKKAASEAKAEVKTEAEEPKTTRRPTGRAPKAGFTATKVAHERGSHPESEHGRAAITAADKRLHAGHDPNEVADDLRAAADKLGDSEDERREATRLRNVAHHVELKGRAFDRPGRTIVVKKEAKKAAPKKAAPEGPSLKRGKGESEEAFRERLREHGRKQLEEQKSHTAEDAEAARRRQRKALIGQEAHPLSEEGRRQHEEQLKKQFPEKKLTSHEPAEKSVTAAKKTAEKKAAAEKAVTSHGAAEKSVKKAAEAEAPKLSDEDKKQIRRDFFTKNAFNDHPEAKAAWDKMTNEQKDQVIEEGLKQESARRAAVKEAAGKTIVAKGHRVTPAQQRALDALEKDPNAKIHPATRKVLEREGHLDSNGKLTHEGLTHLGKGRAEKSAPEAPAAKSEGKTVVAKKEYKVTPAQQRMLEARAKGEDGGENRFGAGKRTEDVLKREGYLDNRGELTDRGRQHLGKGRAEKSAPKAVVAKPAGKTVVAKKAVPAKKSVEEHVKAIDAMGTREEVDKYLAENKITNADLREIVKAQGKKPTSNMTKAQLHELVGRGARLRGYKEAVNETMMQGAEPKKPVTDITDAQQRNLEEVAARLGRGEKVQAGIMSHARTGGKGLNVATLKRLEDKGYIERRDDNGDSTKVGGNYHLTDAGRKHLGISGGSKGETREQAEARIRKTEEEDKQRMLARPGAKEQVVQESMTYLRGAPGGHQRKNVDTAELKSRMAARGITDPKEQDAVLAKMERDGQLHLSDGGKTVTPGKAPEKTEPEKPKKPSAAERRAAGEGAMDRARERQKRIDKAKAVANLSREVQELHGSETEPEVIRRHIDHYVKNHPGDENVKALADKIKAANTTAEMDRIAHEGLAPHGLTAVGRAGDIVAYDRTKHDPIDRNIRDGQKVMVIRPGHTLRDEGEDVRLSKAMVMEATPSEIRAAEPKKAAKTVVARTRGGKGDGKTAKERAAHLDSLRRRDEVRDYLQGMSKDELRDILDVDKDKAAHEGSTYRKSDTVRQLQDRLVTIHGGKEDYDAIMRGSRSQGGKEAVGRHADTGKIEAGKLSSKPKLKNTWGAIGPVGDDEIRVHKDSATIDAMSHLGDQAALDVDGDRLDNVLGRLATESTTGKITSKQHLEQLKALETRLPEGRAKNAVKGLIEHMDQPLGKAPELPDTTPAPLKKLMSDLADIPLAHNTDKKDSEMDILASIVDDWHNGKFGRSGLLAQLRQLENRRHESQEGKFEIDRAIRNAIDDLDKMDRKILNNPPGKAKAPKLSGPDLTKLDRTITERRAALARATELADAEEKKPLMEQDLEVKRSQLQAQVALDKAIQDRERHLPPKERTREQNYKPSTREDNTYRGYEERFAPGGAAGGHPAAGSETKSDKQWVDQAKKADHGEAALEAVPAKLEADPRGHQGHYENESLEAPAGSGSARALSEMEGLEFDTTNGYLWKPNPDHHKREQVEERIHEVDKTMEHSPLRDDAVVYRGVKSGPETFGHDVYMGIDKSADFDTQDRQYEAFERGEVLPDLTGLEWTQHSYLHTTVNADRLAGYAVKREGSYPVAMTIILPKGTGAVRMSGIGHEAEIMAQRGLKLRIVADHGLDKYGVRHVDVEVVGVDQRQI